MNRRIFVGIPVPLGIQKSLTTYCESIAQESLRFTKPENYHITLSFFGEQEERFVLKLEKSIRSVISDTPSFSLQFDSIAFAPPKREPSMIWAQYRTNDAFTKLVNKLETELKHIIHFTDKRNGHAPIPHITLARFKLPQSYELPQIELDSVVITAAALFESKRTENGIVYTTLSEFQLAY
jgi:RNA 2',3'-cyclic 3'-phosphodiesterase